MAIETNAMTYVCRTCGESRPIEEFDVRADTGKRKTQCRDCRRAYQNARNARLHPHEPKPRRVTGTTELLRCTRCGGMKPATAFPPRRRGQETLQTWCRDCFAEVNGRRYRAKHATELARLLGNVALTKAANQAAIVAYLKTHPCVDCGETDAVVLEFDHERDKKADISKLVNSGATWLVVEREIQKCQVRCANCHRIRTGQRASFDSSSFQLELVSPLSETRDPICAVETEESGRTRTCRVCEKEQPIDRFALRSSASGKRKWICHSCQSDYHREWYRRSRTKVLVRVRRDRRRRKPLRQVVQRRVWQYLLEHPCIDCGKTDPRVLDFDHRREKVAEVGRLVASGLSWGRVLVEIAKCEVRCANCHRRRTAHSLGYYRVRMATATGIDVTEARGISNVP